MEKNTKYYLIYDRLLGKEEDGKYYLYKEKQWIPDDKCVILDHLLGYDPGEDPDSPYGIGCTDIMEEIEEITPKKAKKIMGED